MSQSKATRPAINYKLKDNPFFAAEQKDTKPPLAKINKNPVTQTTSKFSQLPTTSTKDDLSKTSILASRKHVRASVQKMADSSTVSSNPWKAKMLKPNVISKKQNDSTNSNNKPSSLAATKKSSPSSSSSSLTTTTSTATVTAPLKNVIPEPSSSSSSSTPTTTEASIVTKTTPSGATKSTQQTEDLVNTTEKITTKSISSSNSTTNNSNNDNDNVTLSTITTKDPKEITVTIEKDNASLAESLSSVIETQNTSIETGSTTTTSTLSRDLSDPMTKPSPMNEKLIHPLDKSTDELETSNIAKGDIERFSSNSVNTVNSSNRVSNMDDDNSVMNEARDLMDSILNSESLSPLPTTSSTTISSNTSSTQKPPSPLPSLLTEKETIPKTEERNVQQPNIGPSITTPTAVTEARTNDSMQTEKEPKQQVDDTKVSLENALEALRPTSGNNKVSVASIHSFSDDGSTSSSSSSDYGDDDDDIAEETTATTFSTNTSSNTLVSSSKSETITTSSTITTATTTTTTAFGITLPWIEYAHGYNSLPSSIDKSNGGKIMMADANEIGRQLNVSHAALIAMKFPTLAGIMDVEKWEKKYSNAKSNVDSIRERVLLETNIQRTYISMLKLSVDNQNRPLVMDIQTRTNNINQLTQDLYYTFSHVCEFQERYLHHLAGTLAMTFQNNERLSSSMSTHIPLPASKNTTNNILSNNGKKRREDYPADVVLRLEKLAKKCSFSLPKTIQNSHHQQDIFKRKTKNSVISRYHVDSVSDDGNLSDDSMFHTSVRTSMTSFDDHQQAHAFLDIIEKQLLMEGGSNNGSHHVTRDKNDYNNNNSALEKEMAQLREREGEMQHRFHTQLVEFSRQRQEWENQLAQAKQQQQQQNDLSLVSTKQLEEQLGREIEARELLEESQRESNVRQAELQKQLDEHQDDMLQLQDELNRVLYQAKQRESRSQDEQATLNRRIQELELELMMASASSASQEKSSIEASNNKISELNQALLQANKHEKELTQKIQEMELKMEQQTTAYHNEQSSSSSAHLHQKQEDDSKYCTLMQEKKAIQAELEVSKQRENSAKDRLDTLHAQVNQALTKTSTSSLETMVTMILQQPSPRTSTASIKDDNNNNSNTKQQEELQQLHTAFKAAQEEYTRREAALMLQSADVEAELGAIFKEYDKLTRNIADFNHERKKYEQQVQALTREKHLLDKNLADYKVKDGIGKDGSTMTLRKEFRQLMAKVKAEHEQEIEKEMEKRREVEIELRNMKHELELKRWDTVNTGVQTNFVAYPIT